MWSAPEPGDLVFSWHLGSLSLYKLNKKYDNYNDAARETMLLLPIISSNYMLWWDVDVVEIFIGIATTESIENTLELIIYEYNADHSKLDADTYLIRSKND